MWLNKFIAWFKSSKSNIPAHISQQSVEEPGIESVSFVRPDSSPSDSINTENRSTWIRQQRKLGRYIVPDSHFKSGGNVRSIPHLEDGSNCTILKRRKLMQVPPTILMDQNESVNTLTHAASS